MEPKKPKIRYEPGGYVTTSRWNLIGALLLALVSVGVVWYFVVTFSPPVEEEPEEEPVARKPRPSAVRKAKPAAVPAPPRVPPKTAPKPKAPPKPAPKPVVVTKAFQDGVAPDRGYRGTEDTYLFQSNPNGPHGKHPTCNVDGDDPSGSGRDAAALFRWNLTTVPRHSLVRGAKVTFHVADPSTDAYKIYRVLQGWTEKRACWNLARDGRKWKRSGGDRDGTELGAVLGKGGAVTVTLNAAGVAVVQEWIKNPDRNYGIILAPSGNQNNGLDLHSREASNAKQRPRLEITYAVSPGP